MAVADGFGTPPAFPKGMQAIQQYATCTRAEAQALLEELRAAYQALTIEERDALRGTLAELGSRGAR